MHTLDQYFEQFLRERTFLQNVTPKTREWYQTAWQAFARAQQTAGPRPSDAALTRADLERFVIHLRERGVKPVSCNTWLRAMNAFCRWLHEHGVTPDLVHLPLQKLEKRLLKTFDEDALRKLLTFRPKTFPHWRVYSVACTILDTGCRIEELLTARVEDFDFHNLLLTVVGKGRKERRVHSRLSFESCSTASHSRKNNAVSPRISCSLRVTEVAGTRAMPVGATTACFRHSDCRERG